MLIHNPEDLALYVRDHRKTQSISQAEIADLVGLKQATVSEFETKSGGTKLETLFRILSASNLEIHVFPKGESLASKKSPWDEN